MRQNRFYYKHPLSIDDTIELDKENSHQICTVLRLKKNDNIWLFNNTPYDYQATIVTASKRDVCVKITEQHLNKKESPVKIYLGQAIAKGQKMDYAIQKSVELGVHEITPIITDRTIVKLNTKTESNKIEHWQKIAINACCQSGRSFVPTINNPMTYRDWIICNQNNQNIILSPTASQTFANLQIANTIYLTIGPEGGLSSEEINMATNNSCTEISLGPRILRTETASLVAISALQLLAGDLA